MRLPKLVHVVSRAQPAERLVEPLGERGARVELLQLAPDPPLFGWLLELGVPARFLVPVARPLLEEAERRGLDACQPVLVAGDQLLALGRSLGDPDGQPFAELPSGAAERVEHRRVPGGKLIKVWQRLAPRFACALRCPHLRFDAAGEERLEVSEPVVGSIVKRLVAEYARSLVVFRRPRVADAVAVVPSGLPQQLPRVGADPRDCRIGDDRGAGPA